MPRIPAAIAVVMLVATCIGFNTARFPVVLEMAAVPEASSSTRVVVCAESTGDATDSDKAGGRYGADTDEAAEVSSSGCRSSWSSYGNDDSEGKSEYSSYSYGSHRSYGEEEEEESDELNEEESSSKYSSLYGSSYASNRYSSGKSHEEEDSSDEDASDSRGDSYGYCDEDSTSSKDGYDGYGSKDSSNQDDSASAKRNRRNKSRAKSDTYGSGGSSGKSRATLAGDDTETGNDYSWNDSSRDESNGDSEYDPYGTNSYADDSYSHRDDSSYGDSSDSYGNTYSNTDENTYGNNNSRDNSLSDSYGNDSSFDNDRSPTRYGERQEAAADDSSTWPGGESVTALPSGPYAYSPPSYEDSAAASAVAVPASSNLGLVPVENEPRSTESWGYSRSDDGYGRSSVSTGYSGQNRRSMASSAPPGFAPLPPVDRSVRVPVFSPLTGGSIPIYPSTRAM